MSFLCPEMESRTALAQHLCSLYPYLKPSDVKRKLKTAAGDPFLFFRAHVAYFYDLLRRKGFDPDFPDFEGIDVIQGWCVGDAHPENFGILYCRAARSESKLIFSMNDPDDGSPGPLYVDLVRLLTSIRLLDPSVSLEPIVNAYRQGLDGDTCFSPVVAREMARSSKNRNRPEKLFRKTRNGSLRPRKRERDKFKFKRKVSPNVARHLEAGVVQLIGKNFRVDGVWSLKKRGGGSGGVRRYWVLLGPPNGKNPSVTCPDSRSIVLDLKRLTRSGMHPLQCPAPGSPPTLACSDEAKMILNRVRETLDLERGSNVGPFCDPVRFRNMPPLLVRARWKGNRGIKTARCAGNELSRLLKDEAKMLGNIHRRSLPRGSLYAGHIYALCPALVEASRQMGELIQRACNASRKATASGAEPR